MPTYYIEYGVGPEGHLDHWLVAGPHSVPAGAVESVLAGDPRGAILHSHRLTPDVIPIPPREWDPPFMLGDREYRWRYVRCLEDHLIDGSSQSADWQYSCGWAYMELACEEPCEVSLALIAHGPADLWHDERPIGGLAGFPEALQTAMFPCALHEGHNRIMVRFEQVACGDAPLLVALRLDGLPAGAGRIILPTICEHTDYRHTVEAAIEATYLDRELYRADDDVLVRWSPDLAQETELVLRLQDLEEHISVEAITTGKAEASYHMVRGLERRDGSYEIRVMPESRQFYELNQRIDRRIGLHISEGAFSDRRYGDPTERRREALEHAAGTLGSLHAELAKMELGLWRRLDEDVIRAGIECARSGDAGRSPIELLALLRIALTHLGEASMPEAVRSSVAAGLMELAPRVAFASPNQDAGLGEQAILHHACQILAAQYLAEVPSPGVREAAVSWMRARGAYGFPHWGGSDLHSRELVALLSLADLSRDASLARLAAAVANKILFSLALHAHGGVPSSPQRGGEARALKNPQLSAACGVTHLAWGAGALNEHLPALVALASARRYSVPAVITRIARHRPRSLWARERHASAPEPDGSGGTPWEVNKALYKTPDYALASVQDWRPGERGDDEHLWQATLGPDVPAFVTHPMTLSEHPALRPNAWRGNAVLPRIAQWQDVLLALHRLPNDDWLGFTHAYFPLYALDEHVIEGDWAFGRVGEGYIALRASHGLTLITRGPGAYRELRSYGRSNVWLCHMGRAAQDGGFAAFCERMRSLDLRVDGLSVRLNTLRGDAISFGWDEPLLVNGAEIPLGGFPHYDTPYCQVALGDSAMTLELGARPLRLDFS